MKNIPNRRIALAVAAGAGVLFSTHARALADSPYFLPGGLVLMQVGSVNPIGGDAVTLSEFDPSTGLFLPSVAPILLPTSGPNAISESTLGIDHERQVNRSADGHYLAFIGYNAAPGPIDPATISALSVPRVVGLLDAAGNLDLSTKLTDAYETTSIRAAYTTDGTSIWTAGDNGSGAVPNGGLHYTTRGSSTSANLSKVQANGGSKTPDNVRSVRVFNGQLYDSSGSNSSIGKGFFQVGTGLPTSGSQSLTTLQSQDSTSGFFFLDTNHDNILDTIYNGSSTNPGVDKYCLINGAWTFEGTVFSPDGHDGDQVTAIENADGSSTIYFGTTQHIFRVTDTTGFGQNFSALSALTLVSATATTTLGGFDFAPIVVDMNQWNHSTGNNWQTGSNWTVGLPDAIGATAIFGGALTTSGTIALNGSRAIGHLIFNNSSANYTIGLSSSETLIIDNSGLGSSGIPSIVVNAGSHNIQATLSLHNSVRVTATAGTTLTIAGPIVGSGGFYSDGMGNLTLSAGNSYSGPTSFASGNVTIANGGSLPASTDLTVGDGDRYTSADVTIAPWTSGQPHAAVMASITINANGTLNLSAPSTRVDRTVLVTSGLALAGTTDAWQGQLDLSGNDLILHNGDLVKITNQIKMGLNGTTWTGQGIASTTAANDSTKLTALGAIRNNGLYSTFDNQPVSSTDVLVKYTYYGDGNLDGRVDASDYTLIDNGFNFALTGWLNGDFNYDGHINGSDYSLIDGGLSLQGAGGLAVPLNLPATATSEISAASVPEPSSLAMLVIIPLLTSRIRRWRSD